MKKFVLIPVFSIIAILKIYSQTDNTFWFAIPHATWQHTVTPIPTSPTPALTYYGGTPVYLRIACSGPTTVTVSIPAKSNYVIATLTNTAFKDTVFSVDMTTYMSASWKRYANPRGNAGPFIDDSIGFKVLNSGLSIVADGNPVTAYWDLANIDNRDLMSLKGQNSLGNEFYIPMQNVWDEVNNLPIDATKPPLNYPKKLMDTARAGFDIIATADSTKISITPTFNANNGWIANSTHTITLNTGQTYSVLVKDNSHTGHAGGSHVKVTNGDNNHQIAITDKDDSDYPLNNGYDYLSDQLVPVNIIGKHYIVTPGRLVATAAKNGAGNAGKNLEWYYITATQNVTTISVNNGGTIVPTFSLNAGQQQGIQPPTYNSANPWSTIDASAPVYVYQVTGFVDEPGAALIPKIDGCTGSQSVFFVTPSVGDSIYLNILAYNNAIYNMYITWPGKATPIHLSSSDFLKVNSGGDTLWYIYKPTKNSFTYGPNKIPYNTACKIYTTTDRFHLGLIAGGGSGAKYGYFSDFAENRGGAIVQRGSLLSPKQVEACFGDTLILVASGGFNYTWSATRFGDTTHLTNLYMTDPTVANPSIFPPPGQYNYSVHFLRPCWGDTTITIQVSIDPQPVANFTIDNSYKCTPPSANPIITFTNTSLGANEFSWSFNYPSVIPASNNNTVINNTYPANTLTTPQQYNVFLLVSNSHYPRCVSTITKPVTILPRIQAAFNDSTATICDSVKINFINQSKYNVADTLYRWDFGDQITSTLKNPSHIFRNLLAGHDTTYNIKLVAISPYNCRDSVTKTMTVHPYVKADFVVDSSKGCSDLTVHINNTSLGVKGAISKYVWNFGNGTKDSTAVPKNYTKTYTDTLFTQYPINLTVSNAGGCKSSLTKQISVYPKVTALFTPDSTTGCTPFTVSFTNKSKGDTSNNMFKWNFGNGNTSSSISPQHELFTNYTSGSDIKDTITLTATSKNYCTSSVTSLVIVHPYIQASFTMDSAKGCSGMTLHINNTSLGVSGAITNYNWNFGNGTTDNTALKKNYAETYSDTLSATIPFQVKLTVSNAAGCQSTLTRTDSVYPKVHAGFAMNNASGCNPDTVSFTPISNKVAVQYTWTFGDGSSSNLQKPTHIFENPYDTDFPFPVKLVVTSNNLCSDTSQSTVTVHERIEADFSVDTAVGCSGFKTNIYNASQGGTGIFSYLWNFGNGTSIFHFRTDPQPSMFPHTFTNPGNNDTTYHFTLTVKNDNSCASTYMVPILVHPHLSASIWSKNTVGCPVLQTTFVNKSNKNAANQIKWDFGDGSNLMNVDSVLHYYDNSDSVNNRLLTAKLVAISTSTGCSDTAKVNINVYPYIKANFSMDKGAVCTYDSVKLTLNGTGKFARTYWDYYGTGTFDSSQSKVINTSFEKSFSKNNGTKPDTFLLKLRVRNTQYCKDSIIKPIIVYPYVNAIFTPSSIAICDSSSISFTDSSNTVATQWNWDFGDGTSSDLKVPPAHVYFHLNSSSKPFTIKLHTVSNYSCVADASVNITVNAYIHSDFTINKSTICPGDGILFDNNSSPGSKHNYWDFNGTYSYIENDTLSFLKTIQNPGTTEKTIYVHLISKTLDQACSDSTKRKVILHAPVKASFNTSDTITQNCNPFTVNFVNQSNSAATNFFWDFGDGTNASTQSPNKNPPPHQFTNPYSKEWPFTVKLHAVSDSGCTHDTFRIIRVFPYIKAYYTLFNSEVCNDSSVIISESSLGDIVHRRWFFEGLGGSKTGTFSGTFSYPYQNLGSLVKTDSLILIVDNGFPKCYDTLFRPITVYPRIISDFDFDPVQGNKSCNPFKNVKFVNKTISAKYYNWDFGNGNTSQDSIPQNINFENLTSKDDTFPVKLHVISKYGCVSDTTKDLIVYAYIEADFKVPNANVCSGIQTQVIDTSLGQVNIRKWTYNTSLDALDQSKSPMIFFTGNNVSPSTRQDTLKLTVYNKHNCPSSISSIITVFPKVTAAFTMNAFPMNAEGCSPFTVNFHTKNLTKNAADFNWTFGDKYGSTSSLEEPIKTFYNYTTNDTVLMVKLLAISNYLCSDSATKTITLDYKPRAVFSLDNTIGCPPFNAVIHNESVTSNATFYWDFGINNGGTTTTNYSDVHHTYYNNFGGNAFESYRISLRAVTNKGCFDTMSLPIEVYPNVKAGFSMDTVGCSPFSVDFNNQSTYPAYYYWDFKDTVFTTQRDPSHVFFNYGVTNRTFPVMLRVLSSYGCKDSIIHDVVAYPAPEAGFTSDKVFDYYPSATFEFYDHTNKGPWVYDWNFGDNKGYSNSKDSVSYTYGHWGSFKVKLYVTSGICSDSAEQTILLKAPIPIADFDSSAAGCSPVTVFFHNNSQYANTYLWDFHDGTTSEKENPSHTFAEPGDYNVVLTIQGDGGSAYDQKMVRVYQNPATDFSVEPSQVMLPDAKIRCFNATAGDNNYLWYFGDGGISSDPNPVYIYTKTGVYSIKLVATSKETQCEDSITKLDIVSVGAPGYIEFPNAFTPNMNGPSGGAYNPADLNNYVFFPVYEGIAEYHLEIYNRWGELLYISNDVTIGWDGYYKDQLCTQGVYVYKAKGKFYNGQSFEKAGDMTLLHKKKL